MRRKKISVVIPTFRRPLYLRRCLTALLHQSFSREEFEVIVVSDGPDKEADSISSSFASHISLIHIQTPFKKGPAAARNIGWLQAKGILVAFTDDDCIPDKSWLETLWGEYDGQNLIAFSGRIEVPLSNDPTDYELNVSNLEKAEFVTANCACTKLALIRIGGFDERFSMARREDSDLHFKFLSHFIPVIPSKATVVHPVRKAEWGISIKEQKKGMFNALLFKKYPDLYRSRIGSGIPANYYAMFFSFAGMLAAIVLNSYMIMLILLLIWLGLVTQFAYKRLSFSSGSPGHICEMFITSMVIPFISLYWQLYGSVKYRVLFL